jgi:hypothetical protein
MARAMRIPVAASISFKTFFIALLPLAIHPCRKKDQKLVLRSFLPLT